MATAGERHYVNLKNAKALIGTVVRSHDFPDGKRDRWYYVEGEVIGVTNPDEHHIFNDCARYIIAVHKRVVRGSEVEVHNANRIVYPPINGTPRIFGECNGVESIDDIPTNEMHTAELMAAGYELDTADTGSGEEVVIPAHAFT